MLKHREIRFATERRGFTFIEIMLVVLIIGILMAVVVPRMVGRTQEARIGAAKASIAGIKTALSQFEIKAGRFPTTQEGLSALVTKPSSLSANEWTQTLETTPKDPWGEEFLYKSPGERNKDYDLYSKGPDKQENTDDDVTNFPAETAGAAQ